MTRVEEIAKKLQTEELTQDERQELMAEALAFMYMPDQAKLVREYKPDTTLEDRLRELEAEVAALKAQGASYG